MVVTLQVQNEAKTPLKRFLLNFAISCKFNEVKKGIIRRDSIWDKLIFNKVQVGCLGTELSQELFVLTAYTVYCELLSLHVLLTGTLNLFCVFTHTLASLFLG